MPLSPAVRSVSVDPFESCVTDAPLTLQRLGRRRLVRPLMTTRLGQHNLRMDAAEADHSCDDEPRCDDHTISSDSEVDAQTRDLLRQLGTLNRLLLGQ